MKDAQDAPAYGRTNWRRFAIAAVIPTAAVVGVMVGVAQGAIPTNIVISGTTFKLSADRLEGNGFTQYSGQVATASNADIPAHGDVPAQKILAISGIHDAKIYNLCQTVAVGPIVLRIEAGKDPDDPATAEDLLIGMRDLGGDATFDHIDIGSDAASLKKDGAGSHGTSGGFGQEADGVTIDNLQQVAYSTSASSFRLPGMSLKLHIGDGEECF
ncbi:cholesterol esterase [Actinoplanes sp. TBRC 11911]|nr:cholesterol esterase [Actinoplanes sp. TBRC 11911]